MARSPGPHRGLGPQLLDAVRGTHHVGHAGPGPRLHRYEGGPVRILKVARVHLRSQGSQGSILSSIDRQFTIN